MSNYKLKYYKTKEHYDYDIPDYDKDPTLITLNLAKIRAKSLMFNKNYYAIIIENNNRNIIEYNKTNFNRKNYAKFRTNTNSKK